MNEREREREEDGNSRMQTKHWLVGLERIINLQQQVVVRSDEEQMMRLLAKDFFFFCIGRDEKKSEPKTKSEILSLKILLLSQVLLSTATCGINLAPIRAEICLQDTDLCCVCSMN